MSEPLTDPADEVRRWRPPEVGAGRTPAAPAAGSAAGQAAAEKHRPPVLTAERLAEIEEQGRAAGSAHGLEEGRRAGEAELRATRARLTALIEQIHPQAAVLDGALLEQLGDLVMAVARQFVRRELKREPGEVVRVVREALAALPASEARIRIHVHPEDAPMLLDQATVDGLERQLRVIEDVTLTRGGTRVETDVSAVDATVETRLNAIAAHLFGDERHDDL